MKFHGDGTEVAGTANMFDSLFFDYIFARLFGATGDFVVVVCKSSMRDSVGAKIERESLKKIKENSLCQNTKDL